MRVSEIQDESRISVANAALVAEAAEAIANSRQQWPTTACATGSIARDLPAAAARQV